MRYTLIILALWCLTACGSDNTVPFYSVGYSLSGTVTDAGGAAVAGVSVRLVGTAAGAATTDTGGNYRFSGLRSGSYSVNPTKVGYAFTPAALPVTVGNADAPGNNFTAAAAPAPVKIQLPKTGQNIMYIAGDDGDLLKGVTWPDPRFIDNADGTVTDHLTGLIWLKNADCFGTRSWRDALVAANTLACGACGLSDHSQAGDWRLPNIVELESLIDIGGFNPAVSVPQPFTNLQLSSYWASSTAADPTYYAWIAYLDVGLIKTVSKAGLIHVWPVRGGTPPAAVATIHLPKTGQTGSYATGDDGYNQTGVVWPAPRFTDTGDGTVTDNLTGLVWLKDANCRDAVGHVNKNKGTLSWQIAFTWSYALESGYCGLNDGSQPGDWRLPNRRELQSLLDRSRLTPALPVGHPFNNVQLMYYWTSSTVAYDPQLTWVINPDNGAAGIEQNNVGDLTNYYVWPVRDGRQ